MKASVWELTRFSILWAILLTESRAEAADWTRDSHGTLRLSQAARWSDPGFVPSRYGQEVSDGNIFPLAVAVFPDTEIGTDEADSPGYLSLPEEVKFWLQRLGAIAPGSWFTRKLSVAYTVHRPCDNGIATWQSAHRSSSSAAVKLLPLSGGQISFKRSLDQGTGIPMASFPNGFFLRRFYRNPNPSEWWETVITDKDTAQALTFAVFIVTHKRIAVHIEIIPSENIGTEHAAVENLFDSHQGGSDALTRLSSWTNTPNPRSIADIRTRQAALQSRIDIDSLLVRYGNLGPLGGIEISPRLLDKYRHYNGPGALPHTKGRFRIALICPRYTGEIVWMRRIAQAAENLGWEWIICFHNPGADTTAREEDWRNKKDLLKTLNPHCAIHFAPKEEWCLKKTQNFLHFHFPGYLSQINEGMVDASCYDGFLVAMPMNKTDKLRRLLADKGKKFFAIPNYPSVCRTLFVNTPKTRLFYCGANWDERGREGTYSKLWTALGDAGYFDAYGGRSAWENAPSAYRGSLPFDTTSVVDKARECGISLVVFGKMHREAGCVSSRPFEAAAAGTVLICDQHAFTREHFGGSVLYIDTDKGPEEIFQEINTHMQWILSHPQEAQELARRSHQIFCEKFALEDLTRDILDLYDSVMQGRAIPGSKVVEY